MHVIYENIPQYTSKGFLVGVRAKQSAAYYKSAARNHDLLVAVVGPIKRFGEHLVVAVGPAGEG